MASMEQLNEYERANRSPSAWGIDKKIPVALIFVVVLQTLGFTWGAATLSSEVKNNNRDLQKLELTVEKISTKLDALQPKSDSLREHMRFDSEIEDVEERVRDIERTRFTNDMWDSRTK